MFVMSDASTDSHGKLNILGVFDVINAQNLPATHPNCAVAVRLRFTRSDGTEHNVRIELSDGDGNPLIPKFEQLVQIKFQEDIPTSTANFILNIQNLTLINYGEYSINLSVGEKFKATIPLYVRRP